MTDLHTEISALLLKQHLFQGLDVAQIQYLVPKFRVVRYRPNQTVIYEDMPGLYFYIVYKGQVQIDTIVKRPLQKKAKYKLYNYGAGNFFGEEAILFSQKNRDVVRTTEESVLLIMDNETLKEVIKNYPTIGEKLKHTAESRRLARSKRYPWLINDEAIMLMGRKHTYFLVRSLMLPIILFLLAIPINLFTSTQLSASTTTTLIQGGALLLVVAAVLWGIWNWIDWGNDFYILTTHRVLWLEKVIGIYENRNEAPLYTILTVDEKSSQLGRILGYGDVSTRTYTGTIDMPHISKPKELSSYIEGHIKRLLLITKDAERDQIKKDVNKALGKEDPTEIDLEELVVKSKDEPISKRKRKLTFSESMQSFMKVRHEQDGIITYRKHWFLLFQKSWIPLLFMTLLIASSTWLVKSNSSLGSQTGSIGPLIGVLILFGLIVWLAYAYVDWKNDIYKLTPEQIFQIYKKPLGTEVKKSASIENILTIVHERENFTGILLNFGTVTVSVGDTELIFDGVFNPDQVHQDIADFQEALKRRKSEQESDRERKKMVDWLMTYNKESENLINDRSSSESDKISG